MNSLTQLENISVLIAEDSPSLRMHLVGLLQRLGVRCIHQCADGAQAVEVLNSLSDAPDVMLIDLNMPIMDGVEFIQHIQCHGWQIPLIICSSHESALVNAIIQMVRGHGLRVVRALPKPVTLERLSEALAECLRAPAAEVGPRPGATGIDPADLARAIDCGDILPYFQPKLDLRRGVIRGAPSDPISPDRFIPVAQANGLIHSLTLSILRQSLARIADWQDHGLTLSVAVNLSAQQLESTTLVAEVGDIVRRARVRPEQLILEITESALIRCESDALGTLVRLRMAGYGLSIDDYGTGYSSMLQLSRVPFTELKIDRSFVHGAHANEHLCAILKSSIEMTGRLGMACVAEGVESLEDWALLQKYGCDIGQGWLVGRAMPAAELLQWLRAHHERLSLLGAAAP